MDQHHQEAPRLMAIYTEDRRLIQRLTINPEGECAFGGADRIEMASGGRHRL